ncbi:hypothetical protein [Methanobrevibacter sp.]|uniref:DUF11 domain-containing protein n=1 Tax=Methanobrevibacter sp. TaxID=66852 RepID=UPI00386D5777
MATKSITYFSILLVGLVLSLGVVSASENFTDTSDVLSVDETPIDEISSFFENEVPHEQKGQQSVSEGEESLTDLQNLRDKSDAGSKLNYSGATNLLKAADTANLLSSSYNNLNIEKSNNFRDDILGVSENESILGDIRYVNADTFEELNNVVSQCKNGDIIDLQGNTLHGNILNVNANVEITIANGVLKADSQLGNYKFIKCILENLTLMNFATEAGTAVNYCTLRNVHFDNFTSQKSVDIAIRYCNLDNVNFTNCHSLMAVDPAGEDFENAVMIVTYNSTFNNCHFINCSSNRHSGAICVAGAKGNVVNITNCVFDNCTSGVGGAIYLHGTGLSKELHSNIINCTFTNCHATEWGGAIGSSQDYLNVENCDFINNTAKQGAAFMVGGITHGLDGDNSEGNYNIMKNCYFFNNTGSQEGGAVHITGHNNTAIDCTFDDNFAINGKGAAIYVKGDHASVINSIFTNHDSEMGTVYVEGNYFNCTHSTFKANHASHGGAGIYVEGNDTYVFNSEFRNNNASMHGGAIHTIGDHARILNSEFRDNHALPSSDDPNYGLGGAIYIDGNHNEISFSTFKHNTARNGSAIYNRGEDLHLNDDTFENNQAWSYFLFTEAKPSEQYWSDDLEFLINVTLIAGDNLINAIYNDWHSPTPQGVVDEIYFHNVTYTLKPNKLYPTGIKTTTDAEVHPVLGVENSNGGAVLYQDAREDNQVINVNVTYAGNKVFEYKDNTDIFGNVLIALKKENLTEGEFHPGIYYVEANHPDDYIYTAIHNSTTFKVLPHVDVSITKTSDKDIYIVGENAVFTITVHGVGTNATNVVVKDILPKSLKYVDSHATKNAYNSTTNEWYIGFLPHGKNETLTLTVKTTELGTFDNVVTVNCTEKDWNQSNNKDNKTIHVNLYYTKEANVTNVSAGENLEYYLRVYNIGSEDYTEVIQIRDVLPKGIKYLNEYTIDGGNVVRYVKHDDYQIWYVTNITAHDYLQITVKCQAVNEGVWNNTMYVGDCPPVNATVNVTINADLRIIKTVSVYKVKKGDIINWTLTVINYGPSDAANVVVTDIMPYGLEIAGSPTVPDGTTFNRQNKTWIIGDLKAKDRIQLIIPTKVTISGINITNEAIVNSTTPDPNPNNNYDNETVEFYPDVSIQKNVSSKKTHQGAVISWTLTVTNHGPGNANGVYVIDRLPSGLRYQNSTKAKGEEYNPATGRWYIGDLAENETVTLVINTLITNYDGFISNNATVYADDDGNPENNYAENFTEVMPEADVGIVKLVSDKNPNRGDVITWTIIVKNYGPSDAKNVRVTDILPDGLIFIGSDGDYDYKTGIWNVGDLASGQPKSLVITTVVNITNKTIVNVANVTSDTPDSNKTNNVANNTTDVNPEADLEIVKLVSNKNPHRGDTITWTIIVSNKGPDVALNVRVTDKLPDGLIFMGSDGDYDYKTGIWNVGNLASGQPKSLVITTVVNITNTTIRNVANVTSDTYDPNQTNNNANNTTDVDPEADLEIVKLVSTKIAEKGDIITWTIIVTNKGPDTALNVIVKDKLPTGLEVKSYSKTKGIFDKDDLVWQIASLAKGENATLTIDTLVTVSDTTLINNVNVTNDVYDPNKTNNEANNTTDISKELPADLEVIKVVSNKNPHRGDTVTWTITVINHGPVKAFDVTVRDKLPEGLQFVSSNGAYDKDTGIWTIGDLDDGASKSLIITTLVTKTNVNITNIAVVNSTTPDNNTDNNKDNDTCNVDPEADVKVIKTVSNPKPSKGDTITWTITVVNFGPDAAKDVFVSEYLPDGLKLLSAKESKGIYENGVWTIGTLDNGEMATLTLTTKVLVSQGTIENIVVVNSTTYDPNMSNNKDIEFTNPKDSSEDDDDEDDNYNPDYDKYKGEGDIDEDSNLDKQSKSVSNPKMHATGNPILIVLLALLAAVGISLRRKN